MNNWIIKDMIKRGIVQFKINDEVQLFRRKVNGYPKFLKDDVIYTIVGIENDFITLENRSGDPLSNGERYKKFTINKMYLIDRKTIRDIKIDSILKL